MGLGVVGAVCRWGLEGLCDVEVVRRWGYAPMGMHVDGDAHRWGCAPMGLQACNGRGGNAKVVS